MTVKLNSSGKVALLSKPMPMHLQIYFSSYTVYKTYHITFLGLAAADATATKADKMMREMPPFISIKIFLLFRLDGEQMLKCTYPRRDMRGFLYGEIYYPYFTCVSSKTRYRAMIMYYNFDAKSGDEDQTEKRHVVRDCFT